MNNDSIKTRKRKLPVILKIITFIYGLLYLVFFIDNSITSSDEPGVSKIEKTVVTLLFVVFLIGYLFLWKNELFANLIFLLWYLGMCYLGLFIAVTDRGASMVLGFPMLVVAILFIISWYKNKNVNARPSSNESGSGTSGYII
jgi:hypothetical protein